MRAFPFLPFPFLPNVTRKLEASAQAWKWRTAGSKTSKLVPTRRGFRRNVPGSVARCDWVVPAGRRSRCHWARELRRPGKTRNAQKRHKSQQKDATKKNHKQAPGGTWQISAWCSWARKHGIGPGTKNDHAGPCPCWLKGWCSQVTLLKVTPVIALMFMVVCTSSQHFHQLGIFHCNLVIKTTCSTEMPKCQKLPHWLNTLSVASPGTDALWMSFAGEICTMTLFEGGKGCNMQASCQNWYNKLCKETNSNQLFKLPIYVLFCLLCL